ncbi:MAG TPA: FHA domain-containing serine/threonine-protein kinase [Solirubrobacteraceae bacterium]|nr:FHA domain-containing serine/threonine-protein kinase [Solirubrobacteraceae bacterium]
MAGEQLRVTDGKERGTLLSVEADLLIGRLAPEDEGRLGGDAEISRRHARISRGADGRLAIEDLGSANGTFVNDERIVAPRALEAGDRIRVGKTTLEVTAAAAPAAAPEPVAVAPAGAPVSGGSRAVLVVSAGPALGRQLRLGEELVIGRAVDGEGRLSEDLELSRRHARIARDDTGRLRIEDLGSANGTFVNGERIRESKVLSVGDSVRIGSTTLELVDVAGRLVPSAPAESPPAPVVAPPAPIAEQPAPAVPRPAPSPVVPRPPAPATAELVSNLPLGSVFAGCRVEGIIGHGDMGVVYRADELALQRPVALKLILPEYSDDERFRERFRRESKIAAAIDHPNVIPVFDAGEEQRVLYIMMRLVEGTDLRALIDSEGALEPLRAARIVRQVGSALDAAHARGMLHRDVKPSNVLLARRDHVYLTDFGLAKPAATLEALTRHGTVVARAEYVAPEQILGQRADARADIYALGCMLYEALTGVAPFAGAGHAAAPLAHLDEPPPSPRELRPDLPPEFDEVVRRAMAKDPQERYPSAGDLGQAALVAAGGLRRARAWSMVATGEAAFALRDQLAAGSPAAGRPEAAVVSMPVEESAPDAQAGAPATDGTRAGRSDLLRWAIALAALVIVAVGMVAALHGISTL